MTRKRLLFLTGTRADFGKLKPLMAAVDGCDSFECEIFVTGMHMMSAYGSTENEVRKAGFKRIFSFMNQHEGEPMEEVLANTISGLSRYVHERHPDLLVVHGDRVEALAGAIVGSINNVLVAHIEGGERSGSIDELIRHAITKMSHLHFVANEEARARLLQMGEDPKSVFVIGSPDIDIMSSSELPSLDDVKSYYEISFSSYGILLFHPVTTGLETLRSDTICLVNAVFNSGLCYVVILPNNDEGTRTILDEYKRFEDVPRMRVFPSMRFEAFLALMKSSRFMIGNSSAGVREAPFFGVPSINVGDRQKKRYSGPTVINVPFDEDAIMRAIEQVDEHRQGLGEDRSFGGGDSAPRFLDTLSKNETWNVSTAKHFIDA